MTREPSTHDGFYSRAAIDRDTTANRFDLEGPLARAIAWLLDCIERRRQRLELAALDDRLLYDIGLSRDDVDSETAKWPWQP